MEIGTSLFGIARKLARWGHGFLEKLICRRAYEISTLYHDHRQLVEARPYPLGEMLGYQLFWDEYLHGARQRAPIIEVRANHGVRLSKVAISVTASNEKVCYQNEVVLRHVDERRHRATLSSIPFRNLKFSGNLVYTPYDTFRVELIEMRGIDGRDVMPQWPVVRISTPMDRLEVALGEQREYVERWGRIYNLRFIELEITEVLVHIRAWRFHRSRLVQGLALPLQSRRIAKALFWARNALSARPLQRALARHISEYQQYDADRQLRQAADPEIEAPLTTR